MATKPQSGFTGNYTDPSSGMTINNAWIEISNILYVPASYCLTVFDVYKDLESKQSGKKPIWADIRYQEDWNSENWNTFFDTSVMDGINKDVQKQSILYIQQILTI